MGHYREDKEQQEERHKLVERNKTFAEKTVEILYYIQHLIVICIMASELAARIVFYCIKLFMKVITF